MSASPLYRSTLDDLVDEDNVVLITDELKKKVEEHGKYISAYQYGLKTRTRLIVGGLALLVVFLVIIVAAFAKALAEKTAHITEMEDAVNGIRNDVDLQIMNPYKDLEKRVESLVESKIGHQIGYQRMWSRPNSVITFGQLILSKGSSHLDVSTGIWTAGTTGDHLVVVSAMPPEYVQASILLHKDGVHIAKMNFERERSFLRYTRPVLTHSLVIALRDGNTLSLKTEGKEELRGLHFSVSFLGRNKK